ncbi:MAG: hypothetical protein HQL67_11345 [Magnetococcales bacterium]|nr:hypothetical protein [Magnetococcales bacterium]
MAVQSTVGAIGKGTSTTKLSMVTVAKAQFIKEAGMGLGMGLGLGMWMAVGAVAAGAAYWMWKKNSSAKSRGFQPRNGSCRQESDITH